MHIAEMSVVEPVTRLRRGRPSKADGALIESYLHGHRLAEQLTDPAFFERMSALLDEIIRLRKQKAIEYEEYLQRIATLTRQVMSGKTDDTPKQLNTPGRLALYNNLKAWVVLEQVHH